jgi:hypothetical protein
MHWAPIPIIEFDLPPSSGFDVPNAVHIFQLLSRGPRIAFWLSAFAFIVLTAIGLVALFTGYGAAGVLCLMLSWFAGVGHMLVRHKLDLALWITREPAAVYWAAPCQWDKQLIWPGKSKYALTLHTPASLQLGALLAHHELIAVLHWLRQHNPDALIGSYSPKDSNGRLSGDDPFSQQAAWRDSGNSIDAS